MCTDVSGKYSASVVMVCLEHLLTCGMLHCVTYRKTVISILTEVGNGHVDTLTQSVQFAQGQSVQAAQGQSAVRTGPVCAVRTGSVCAVRTGPVCAVRTGPVCAVRTDCISDFINIGNCVFLLFIWHALSLFCATHSFAVQVIAIPQMSW
jgi:hypothetical protein